jgi:hypothetical protein
MRRITVDDWDYSAVATLGDAIVLDWDIAASREDLRSFAETAALAPDSVLVAPYRLYGRAEAPVWAAKVYEHGERSMRFVDEGEAHCHLFGFGMVYLPGVLTQRFVAEHPGVRMDDMSFSGWHYRHVTQCVTIDWRVRPVHLHYPLARNGELP